MEGEVGGRVAQGQALRFSAHVGHAGVRPRLAQHPVGWVYTHDAHAQLLGKRARKPARTATDVEQHRVGRKVGRDGVDPKPARRRRLRSTRDVVAVEPLVVVDAVQFTCVGNRGSSGPPWRTPFPIVVPHWARSSRTRST